MNSVGYYSNDSMIFVVLETSSGIGDKADKAVSVVPVTAARTFQENPSP